MDPTLDDPAPPSPTRLRAHGRPALARAVASGLAMGLAAVPLAFLADEGSLLIFAAVAGALAGAPAAALEARAREPGRSLTLTAIACGLLLPAAGLLLSVQLIYAQGVLGGGVEHGLSKVADLLADARRAPGALVAIGAGVSLGLALPLAHVVGLRLKEPDLSIAGQSGATGIVVFVEMMALGFVGWVVVLTAGRGAVDAALSVRPLAMGLATVCALAAATLLFVGLAMAALLPGALALADRFGAPPAPRGSEL